MIRIILLIVAMEFITGCSNQEESSPFGDLLLKPPYAELTDSIKEEPARDELYFRRAVLLNQNDLPEPALADFRKAWSLQKEEKYAFGISTILLEKNPDSAMLFLDTALRELPKSTLLGLSLAHGYDAQNKTEAALKVCEGLLQSNPEQVDVLKLKAHLLDKKGEPAEAIRTLEKGYALTPFDFELFKLLALAYAEDKNSKVIGLCDSLIKKDSLGLLSDPFYYKGIYFANINDQTKALTLFNEAIQHNYNFLEAHIEKGIVLYEQKKYADAYNAFNLAMTISPKYADSYYWMGKCQQAMGKPQEARLNYERAYGLNNTLTEAKDSADKIKLIDNR